MKTLIKYYGPNQKEEERCIVLGMACPDCGGPVYDPRITYERRKRMSYHEHRNFKCMNPRCTFEVNMTPFSPKKRGFPL